MEEVLIESVEYGSEIINIVQNQEQIILLLQDILGYVEFISKPIWFIAVVVIPLYGLVGFLWWFMKQFIQKY